MSKDLNGRIINWLDTQGYNLEMFVARTFRENGFQVAQSVYYQDSESGQSREIDLVCYYSTWISDVKFNLTFVVECKKSTDKPWLIFKSSGSFQRYNGYDQIEATVNGHILLKEIDKRGESSSKKKTRKPIDFFEYQNVNLGYGVTQAFTTGADNTYAATTTVSKSIRYFVEKYNNIKVKQCSLYFPVVVIDAKLFDIELGNNNELSIQEVNESKLLKIRSDLNQTNIIQLTTKEGLSVYCSELRKQCERFLKKYSNEIDSVIKTAPYCDKNSNKYKDVF